MKKTAQPEYRAEICALSAFLRRMCMPVLLTILLAPGIGSGAETGFSLQVEGNKSPGATLYIALYRAELADWGAEPSHKFKYQLPENARFELSLDVPAGQYAMRAFVDLDGDGQLATGALGKPKEPFTSSIGTDRSRPSLHFKHSVFTLGSDTPGISAKLRYPKR